MVSHQELLVQLAMEIYPPDRWSTLNRVAMTRPLDRRALIEFDDSVWGPSISRLAEDRRGAPGTLGIPGHGVGRYAVADRDVFRPLQYCAVYLTDMEKNVDWLARDVVEMSSAHIEELVKRIGMIPFLPLGTLLLKPRVRRKLGSSILDRLERFTSIYNLAKHEFNQPKDTHMFSVQDAVLAYAVSRRLGQDLYPLARLKTDWRFGESRLLDA